MTLSALVAMALAGMAAPVGGPAILATEKDYPDEARRRDLQGDVQYRLEVDAAGKATNCVITSTAGNDALDRATCKVAIRAKYQPALDDQGRAVPGQFQNWMMWNLSDGTPPSADGHSINVVFNAAGEVVACRVSRIVYQAILTIPILRRCESMGNASVFASFLGRSTVGLKSAAIRSYTTSKLSEHFDTGADLRRERTVVEFDQDRSGVTTACKVVVAPIMPGADSGRDMCGPGGFAVRAGSGNDSVMTKRFTIDAVATLVK